GVVLFELLTGRLPFPAGEVSGVIRRDTRMAAPRPGDAHPGLHPDLEAVVLQCLAPEPGARYPTAGALAADLRRWLDGDPTRARPPGWAARHRRELRRGAVGLAALL